MDGRGSRRSASAVAAEHRSGQGERMLVVIRKTRLEVKTLGEKRRPVAGSERSWRGPSLVEGKATDRLNGLRGSRHRSDKIRAGRKRLLGDRSERRTRLGDGRSSVGFWSAQLPAFHRNFHLSDVQFAVVRHTEL